MIDYECVLHCSKTIAMEICSSFIQVFTKVTAVFSKLLHLKDNNITYFSILIEDMREMIRSWISTSRFTIKKNYLKTTCHSTRFKWRKYNAIQRLLQFVFCRRTRRLQLLSQMALTPVPFDRHLSLSEQCTTRNINLPRPSLLQVPRGGFWTMNLHEVSLISWHCSCGLARHFHWWVHRDYITRYTACTLWSRKHICSYTYLYLYRRSENITALHINIFLACIIIPKEIRLF
jgi:hypothetical protein